MKSSVAAKLAIGTVQFGLNYGVANISGQVAPAEARRILDAARSAGVDTLDTAIAYGNAESVLGALGMGSWRVITKLPPMPSQIEDPGKWVQEQVNASCCRLGVKRLSGLMLHRTDDLLRHPALARAMLRLKAEGITQKIGVSVYDPQELDAVHRLMPLDIVQAPLNVFDRRILGSGWAQRLRDSGAELHTRSAFLQGLLLMPTAQRPSHFDRWEEVWSRWDSWLETSELDPLSACLGYVLHQPDVSKVVVGVDHLQQLASIIQASARIIEDVPDFGASIHADLIHPGRWNISHP